MRVRRSAIIRSARSMTAVKADPEALGHNARRTRADVAQAQREH
jgi:hypothetical protein